MFPLGIIIGVVVGIALGIALKSIAIGIGVGSGQAMIFGLGLDRRRRCGSWVCASRVLPVASVTNNFGGHDWIWYMKSAPTALMGTADWSLITSASLKRPLRCQQAHAQRKKIPRKLCFREAWEETGLEGLKIGSFFGQIGSSWPGNDRVLRRQFYHLICNNSCLERNYPTGLLLSSPAVQ